MLPQRALGSQPWTSDAHSFSSGNTHTHTYTSHPEPEFFHVQGRRSYFAYPRSVCRCPGNLPHKHICSRRGCSHTRCGRCTRQDSPHIHPHLGQRRGHRTASYAQLYDCFSPLFTGRKKQQFVTDHVEPDRKATHVCAK